MILYGHQPSNLEIVAAKPGLRWRQIFSQKNNFLVIFLQANNCGQDTHHARILFHIHKSLHLYIDLSLVKDLKTSSGQVLIHENTSNYILPAQTFIFAGCCKWLQQISLGFVWTIFDNSESLTHNVEKMNFHPWKQYF